MNNSTISLNNCNKKISIVLITQGKLRHKRFIVRFYQEFEASISNVIIYNTRPTDDFSFKDNYTSIFAKLFRVKFFLIFKKIISNYNLFFVNRKHRLDMIDSEIRLNSSFEKKFNEINFKCSSVSKFDDVYSIINEVKPTFLISLGGPLIPDRILNLVSGFCINQHAGISPNYKGNYTTFWPLFHRKILMLGTTVHLTQSGADSGSILAQERLALDSTDTPGSIFHKSVIAGTELMIKVVSELIQGNQVCSTNQDPLAGNTYLSKDFTPYHKSFIYEDFKRSFLIKELNNMYKI